MPQASSREAAAKTARALETHTSPRKDPPPAAPVVPPADLMKQYQCVCGCARLGQHAWVLTVGLWFAWRVAVQASVRGSEAPTVEDVTWHGRIPALRPSLVSAGCVSSRRAVSRFRRWPQAVHRRRSPPRLGHWRRRRSRREQAATPRRTKPPTAVTSTSRRQRRWWRGRFGSRRAGCWVVGGRGC